MEGQAEDGTVRRESCPGGSRLLQLQTEVSFPCEAVNQDRSFHGAESWGSRWCERSDINMGSLQTESAILILLADG